MATYKLFLKAGSEICSVQEFEAEDDEAARRHVDKEGSGRSCELWNSAHVIQKYSEQRTEDVEPPKT